MLFTGPFWVSLLSPIAFSLVLLVASLMARYWRGVRFEKAPWLTAAGVGASWALGGRVFTGVLVAFVVFTYWAALAIERSDPRTRDASPAPARGRIWLLVAVGAHLVLVTALWRLGMPRTLGTIRDTLVPVGVSYFAFQGISYVIDVYRRRAPAERSVPRLAVYLLLLPQIVGAPLTYSGVAPQLVSRWPSVGDFSFGVRRLVIGVWKLFVVAYLLGDVVNAAFTAPSRLNAATAWIGLASFAVQMYYAFSGYSDMAIGLGRMLGVRLPENFRWPYVADSIRDFWRRWHTGLFVWFREYADLSLERDHVPPPTAGREALVVLLCGIWYGMGWPFFVWGIYQAALVNLERAGFEARLRRLPAALRHVYVVAIVLVGWAILRSATLAGALVYLKALVGLNAPVAGPQMSFSTAMWILLAVSAIGCAPLFQTIRRWTVTIDALIVSILVMVIALVIYTWRIGEMVASPVARFWRRAVLRWRPERTVCI